MAEINEMTQEAMAQENTGPPPADVDDDVYALDQTRNQDRENAIYLSELYNEFPDLAKVDEDEQPPPSAGVTIAPVEGFGPIVEEQGAAVDDETWWNTVANEVYGGTVGAPLAVAGGVQEGLVREPADMARELGDWLSENYSGPLEELMGSGFIFDDKGVHFASREEWLEKSPNVETLARKFTPDIDRPDSTTGSLLWGISQFMSPFMASKILPLVKSIKGPIKSATVRAGLADFAGFDPEEANLADLVQSAPWLENPITEILTTDMDSNAALERLKNAAAGSPAGLGVEGIKAIHTMVLAHKAARRVKNAVTKADDSTPAMPLSDEALVAKELQQVENIARGQKTTLTEMFGDPADDIIKVKKEAAAIGKTADEGHLDRPDAELPSSEAARPDRVYINWSRMDSVDNVNATAQRMADQNAGRLHEAARGKRTWEQTRLAAAEEDAWEILAKRRVGDPLNAEKTLALREMWAQSTRKLIGMAETLQGDPTSRIARIAFLRQLSTHNMIQEAATASRAEVARATNAWKIPLSGGDDLLGFADDFDKLAAMAADNQTASTIADRMLALSKAGMASELDHFVQGTWKAKGAGMVRQFWYMSLLSGMHTHARNFLSTASVIGIESIERRTAAAIGKVKGQQHIPDGEAAARLFGFTQGLRDAFVISAKGREAFAAATRARFTDEQGNLKLWGTLEGRQEARQTLRENEGEFGNSWRAGATGESVIGGAVKYGVQESGRSVGKGAFDPNVIAHEGSLLRRAGVHPDNPAGRILSVVDTATQSPTRALLASDELFKSLNFRMELNGYAYRKAYKEFEQGRIPKEGVNARIKEILSDPSETHKYQARQHAKEATFTNTPMNTGAWRAFSGIQNFPVIGTLMIPFRRTVWNIGIYSNQRTPLAKLTGRFNKDMAAGGARRDMAQAKLLTGSAYLLTFTDLALSGWITGSGPRDPQQRATWTRMNYKPYSIRPLVGDDPNNPEHYRNYSTRGLEPIGYWAGLAGNLAEYVNYQDWDENPYDITETMLHMGLAAGEQFTASYAMSGANDMIKALSDPKRYGESWWLRTVGTAVPTAMSQVAKSRDPYQRAVTNMMDKLRSRTPGLSEDVPVYHDRWGQKRDHRSGLGPAWDVFSPVYSSRKNVQPIDKELWRLEAYLGPPSKTLAFDVRDDNQMLIKGVKINLRNDPAIYERYKVLAGNEIRLPRYGNKTQLETLNAMVTENTIPYSLLADGDDGGKAREIRSIVSEYQEAARAQLLEEFPALEARVKANKHNRSEKYDMERLMGNE